MANREPQSAYPPPSMASPGWLRQPPRLGIHAQQKRNAAATRRHAYADAKRPLWPPHLSLIGGGAFPCGPQESHHGGPVGEVWSGWVQGVGGSSIAVPALCLPCPHGARSASSTGQSGRTAGRVRARGARRERTLGARYATAKRRAMARLRLASRPRAARSGSARQRAAHEGWRGKGGATPGLWPWLEAV